MIVTLMLLVGTINVSAHLHDLPDVHVTDFNFGWGESSRRRMNLDGEAMTVTLSNGDEHFIELAEAEELKGTSRCGYEINNHTHVNMVMTGCEGEDRAITVAGQGSWMYEAEKGIFRRVEFEHGRDFKCEVRTPHAGDEGYDVFKLAEERFLEMSSRRRAGVPLNIPHSTTRNFHFFQDFLGPARDGGGATCTCPDGTSYLVGALNGNLDSMACHGGVVSDVQEGNGPWTGRVVVCAGRCEDFTQEKQCEQADAENFNGCTWDSASQTCSDLDPARFDLASLSPQGNVLYPQLSVSIRYHYDRNLLNIWGGDHVALRSRIRELFLHNRMQFRMHQLGREVYLEMNHEASFMNLQIQNDPMDTFVTYLNQNDMCNAEVGINHLITGGADGTGVAFGGGVCNGCGNAGITSSRLDRLLFAANVVAHEVGHNFGGAHGEAEIESGCRGYMIGGQDRWSECTRDRWEAVYSSFVDIRGQARSDKCFRQYSPDALTSVAAGCPTLTTEDSCVASKDGRQGEFFTGSPCAWCCGETCTPGGSKCEATALLEDQPTFLDISFDTTPVIPATIARWTCFDPMGAPNCGTATRPDVVQTNGANDNFLGCGGCFCCAPATAEDLECVFEQGFLRAPFDTVPLRDELGLLTGENSGRSQEPSAEACHQRCLDTVGCAFFSFFPDGGCHLTDDRAGRFPRSGLVTGNAACVPTNTVLVQVPTSSNNIEAVRLTGAPVVCPRTLTNRVGVFEFTINQSHMTVRRTDNNAGWDQAFVIECYYEVLVPFCADIGREIPGSDLDSRPAIDPEECQTICQADANCNSWTFNGATCFLKTANGASVSTIEAASSVSGPKECPKKLGHCDAFFGTDCGPKGPSVGKMTMYECERACQGQGFVHATFGNQDCRCLIGAFPEECPQTVEHLDGLCTYVPADTVIPERGLVRPGLRNGEGRNTCPANFVDVTIGSNPTSGSVTVDISGRTALERLACGTGQGELGQAFATGADATLGDCAERCANTADCVALDFTESGQADSCRFYRSANGRIGDGGVDNRVFCKPEVEPLSCGTFACASYYDNIRGNGVENLFNAPSFPNNPDEVTELDSLSTEANRGDEYGAMVEAWIHVPTDGEYVFTTNSDDHSEVYVMAEPGVMGSTDEMIRVVQLIGCCRTETGTVAIPMVAGFRYFLRGFMKEAGAGDNFDIGFINTETEQSFAPIVPVLPASTRAGLSASGLICPRQVNRETRIPADGFGDTFDIIVDGVEVTAERTDAPGAGWDLDLTVRCFEGRVPSHHRPGVVDCMQAGVDYEGNVLRELPLRSPGDCQDDCRRDRHCAAWSWKTSQTCTIKSSIENTQINDRDSVFGTKSCLAIENPVIERGVGCTSFTTEAECLAAVDGRTSGSFAQNACAWCCGESCGDSEHLCEATDFLATNAPNVGRRDATGFDNCPTGFVDINIGLHTESEERVLRTDGVFDLLNPRGVTCPREVSRGNWVNSDDFSDRFEITVVGRDVQAVRLDAPGVGWGLDLTIRCFEAIPECAVAGFEYTGDALDTSTTNTAFKCMESCAEETECRAWTWDVSTRVCSLMSSSALGGLSPHVDAVSGLRTCAIRKIRADERCQQFSLEAITTEQECLDAAGRVYRSDPSFVATHNSNERPAGCFETENGLEFNFNLDSTFADPRSSYTQYCRSGAVCLSDRDSTYYEWANLAGDFVPIFADTPEECRDLCLDTYRCYSWTQDPRDRRCYLSDNTSFANFDLIFGTHALPAHGGPARCNDVPLEAGQPIEERFIVARPGFKRGRCRGSRGVRIQDLDINPESFEVQDACLRACRAVPGATACEMQFNDLVARGCFVHTTAGITETFSEDRPNESFCFIFEEFNSGLFNCEPGRGGNSLDFAPGNDATVEDCAARCESELSCEGFDYAASEGPNRCRLLSSIRNVLYGMPGDEDRQVCTLRAALEPESSFSRYYCETGQGRGETVEQFQAGSAGECAARCTSRTDCAAFDFSTSLAGSICRLFRTNTSRIIIGGPDNRIYCVPDTFEGSCAFDGAEASTTIQLNAINPNTPRLQASCLEACNEFARTTGITGCEARFDRSEPGCYAHTARINGGNGASNRLCTLFPEPQEYQEAGCFTVGWDRSVTEDVPNTIEGVQKCRDFCNDAGYPYFGLECPGLHGVNCECGDNILVAQSRDGSECRQFNENGASHCNGPFLIEDPIFGTYAMGAAGYNSGYTTAPYVPENELVVECVTSKDGDVFCTSRDGAAPPPALPVSATPAPVTTPTNPPTDPPTNPDVAPLSCGAFACASYYDNINGVAVSDLMNSPSFPANPDEVTALTALSTERNRANNYGVMVEAWIRAPTTGDYVFQTNSDDASEVYVMEQAGVMGSTDEMVLVVELLGCCRTETGTVTISMVAGRTYFLRGFMKEGGGGDNFDIGFINTSTQQTTFPIGSAYIATDTLAPLSCGTLACASYYDNIGGTELSDLRNAPNFPANPDEVTRLTALSTERNRADNYGVMVEAWIKAPTSGDYVFQTNSDDSSAVYVMAQAGLMGSTDEMVLVVELVGCCRTETGTVTISMVAGRSYFLRGFMKEGAGGDNFDIGFVNTNTQLTIFPLGRDQIATLTWTEPADVSFGPLSCGGFACASYYDDIGGVAVRDLTNAPNFPVSPNEVSVLTSLSTPDSRRDDYGVMIEAWIQVPTTGDYVFSTRSDDASEVYVMPQPEVFGSFDNMVRVVELTSCCRTETGTVTVSMEAGRRYFLRGFMKEGSGGDYFEIGFVNTNTGENIFPIGPAQIASAQESTARRMEMVAPKVVLKAPAFRRFAL